MIIVKGIDKLLLGCGGIERTLKQKRTILEIAADDIQNDINEAVENRTAPDITVGSVSKGKWISFKHSSGFSPPTNAVRYSGDKVTISCNISKYAYIHYGTKATTIMPKAKKFLKFNIDGKEVFAKSVASPGMPARGFYGYNESTVDDIMKKIILLFGEES